MLEQLYAEAQAKGLNALGEVAPNPLLTAETVAIYDLAATLFPHGRAIDFLSVAQSQLDAAGIEAEFVDPNFFHIALARLVRHPDGRRAAAIDVEYIYTQQQHLMQRFASFRSGVNLKLHSIFPVVNPSKEITIVAGFLPHDDSSLDIVRQLIEAGAIAPLPHKLDFIHSSLARLHKPPSKPKTLLEVLQIINARLHSQELLATADSFRLISTTPRGYLRDENNIFVCPPISLIGDQDENKVGFIRARYKSPEINQPNIKAVIFDFGDVLIENPDADMISLIGQYYGIDFDQAHKAWLQVWPDFLTGKANEVETWQRFSQLINKPTPNLDKLHQALTAGFPKNVIPEMKTIADNLARGGYILIIHTDTLPPHEQFFRNLGMYDGFEVITSPQLRMTKSSPGTFIQVAHLLGLDPEQCLFIDDKPDNVSCAQQAGMRAIQFSVRDYQTPAEGAQNLQQKLDLILGPIPSQ